MTAMDEINTAAEVLTSAAEVQPRVTELRGRGNGPSYAPPSSVIPWNRSR